MRVSQMRVCHEWGCVTNESLSRMRVCLLLDCMFFDPRAHAPVCTCVHVYVCKYECCVIFALKLHVYKNWAKQSQIWNFFQYHRVAERVKATCVQHIATHCNTLQHTATHCSIDTWVSPVMTCWWHWGDTSYLCATHCNTLQHVATHCCAQHAATHCNTLQHTVVCTYEYELSRRSVDIEGTPAICVQHISDITFGNLSEMSWL